jgi:Ca2+-binding RTX toxin-like protein
MEDVSAARRRRGVRAVIGVLVVMAIAAGVALARAYYEGTNGDDNITASNGSSTAFLLDGNDTFHGAAGADGGDDVVYGGLGNDTIVGRTYGDNLHGNRGNDTIEGDGGVDGLYGGADDDTLTSGKGVDYFRPRSGSDTCFGQRKDYGFPRRCEHPHVVAP